MKCRSEWQDFYGFGQFGKVLKNEDNLTLDLFLQTQDAELVFSALNFIKGIRQFYVAIEKEAGDEGVEPRS